MWAKQSTAATLIVGPILDSTGAEYTSAVIGDLSISKNGGTLTALAGAADLTHIANGQYTLVMTTGNLDTLGRVQITCNKSTYQMPPIGLVVVPAMVFDSMVLGTDRFDTNVTHVADTAQTAQDIGANVDVAVSTRSTFAGGAVASVAGNVGGNVVGSVGSVAAGVVLDSAATAALVDLIWDEPLTGATHNVATSSGKRLRQTTAFQQIDSTVIDASATTTTFVTGLTSSVDDFYNDSMLVFTDGALAGQVRAIYDYIGATKTIILEEALTSAPVNGVAFAVVSLHIHPVSQIQSGLATSAALATESTKITAIETFATRVTTGLVADGAAYQFTANMLELGPAGSGGGSGTGARTVTITVNDGTTVLQNATVRMTEGANTFTSLTNVTGVAVFNLDDATYTVGVTKSGYSYAGTTLIVNGTETATYSMTVVSITPPSNPSLSAIVVLCLDAAGQPEASVAIDIRIVTVPSGSQNIAYKGAKQTATSNVNGIAQFEVVQGSVCEWKRGKADVWSSVTIDSDSMTNVTSVIGSP
jgi:hypothetical protein